MIPSFLTLSLVWILDPDLILNKLEALPNSTIKVSFRRMVTYDEGDYEGGQEEGRPQGHGKMIYSESDPLGRLVIDINYNAALTMWLWHCDNATHLAGLWFLVLWVREVWQCGCSQIKLRGQLGRGSTQWWRMHEVQVNLSDLDWSSLRYPWVNHRHKPKTN